MLLGTPVCLKCILYQLTSTAWCNISVETLHSYTPYSDLDSLGWNDATLEVEHRALLGNSNDYVVVITILVIT